MDAKTKAFNTWKQHLPYLQRFKKLKDYGLSETPESLWKKLPESSQEYWKSVY